MATFIFPAKIIDDANGEQLAAIHVIADRDLDRISGELIREIDKAASLVAAKHDKSFLAEEAYPA